MARNFQSCTSSSSDCADAAGRRADVEGADVGRSKAPGRRLDILTRGVRDIRSHVPRPDDGTEQVMRQSADRSQNGNRETQSAERQEGEVLDFSVSLPASPNVLGTFGTLRRKPLSKRKFRKSRVARVAARFSKADESRPSAQPPKPRNSPARRTGRMERWAVLSSRIRISAARASASPELIPLETV